MVQEITVQEETTAPSFLKDKHELAKLLKTLDKASAAAVKLLTDIVDNADPDMKVDLTQRQKAAEKIIDFYLATSKQVNDDELSRLIAQVKLGSKKRLTLDDDTGEVKPKAKLDFSDIRKV
jgi:phosphate uptake regulator